MQKEFNKYLSWFFARVFTPIIWFASTVFVTGKMVGPEIEFLMGATVLVVWAIVIDFPRRAD